MLDWKWVKKNLIIKENFWKNYCSRPLWNIGRFLCTRSGIILFLIFLFCLTTVCTCVCPCKFIQLLHFLHCLWNFSFSDNHQEHQNQLHFSEVLKSRKGRDFISPIINYFPYSTFQSKLMKSSLQRPSKPLIGSLESGTSGALQYTKYKVSSFPCVSH